MRHRDHDVSLLVSLLNIFECFRYPLERIASVDDRPEAPSLGQCGDETHVRHVSESHTALDLLSASDRGPHHSNDVAQLHDVLKENAGRLQRALAVVKRRRADDVEYQVIRVATLREV